MNKLNKRHRISQILRLHILLLLFGIFSCNNQEDKNIERSFYYWKSVLNITPYEKQQLEYLKVKTVYLKFFDVDWNEAAGKPVPVAKLQAAKGQLPEGIRIIPAVFITNACIQKIDSSQISKLAIDLVELIKTTAGVYGLPLLISEIQIDCDWTAASKANYFALLTAVKKRSGIETLSVTIRLHQVKFLAKSGVPPADRGLLMCYNMGNLKDPATKNSILETAELKKYILQLPQYPLPLDVAFPLFNWKVLYRNNFYTGLIQHLPDSLFQQAFSTKTGNRFLILKDTMLQGYDLRKGDMIRDEQSNIHELLSAAIEVNKHLKNTPGRVSFYHLDSVILSKYSTYELESIYNSLR